MHGDKRNRGTVIVTGGSRGIGAAISRLAAAQGYSVAVNFWENDKAAAALINEIKQSGGRCTAIRADVANETDVQHLFAEAERHLGPLTALVNNAGITGSFARVDSGPARDRQRVRSACRRGARRCGASGGQPPPPA
jgi:NAD(P)-dependent dehydrogenase (short-subunit alcohol dehydrogenase family)